MRTLSVDAELRYMGWKQNEVTSNHGTNGGYGGCGGSEQEAVLQEDMDTEVIIQQSDFAWLLTSDG